MPAPLLVGDITDVEYIGSSTEEWYVEMTSGSGLNLLGTFINTDSWKDANEVTSDYLRIEFTDGGGILDISEGDYLVLTISSGYTVTEFYIMLPDIGDEKIYWIDTQGNMFLSQDLTQPATDWVNVQEEAVAGAEIAEEVDNRPEETVTLTEDILTSRSTLDRVRFNEQAFPAAWSDETLTIAESYNYYIGEHLHPVPHYIPYTGSNIYDLENPIYDSRLAPEKDPVVSSEVKFFIKDDNEEWVDFSDRMEERALNKLMDYGVFKHASEKRGGLPILESTVGAITLDNNDGFFEGRAVPLTTELGNTASFLGKPIYGSNILTDGNFTYTTTNWTEAGNADVSGGTASLTGDGSTSHYFYQTPININQNAIYKFSYEVISNSLTPASTNNLLSIYSDWNFVDNSDEYFDASQLTIGTHTENISFTPGTYQFGILTANAATGGTIVFDNFSVQEIKTRITTIESPYREREVRFQLYLTLINDSVEIREMGVYIIKELETSFGKENIAKVSFETKMNALKKMDASIVKDGVNWYRNRSINFLVKELLKTKFANDDGEIPESFYINEHIQIPVPSEIGRTYSYFGVPPLDETGRNIEISFIRAMEIWIWNTGTIASTSNYSYTIIPNNPWGAQGSQFELRPQPGDVIVIKDSLYGNDGSYKIKDINYGVVASILLEEPLKGLTESGMSYTVTRLYFIHKDKELWYCIPERNKYFFIDDIDTYLGTYNETFPTKLYINSNLIYIVSQVSTVNMPEFWFSQTQSGSSWISKYNGTSITQLLASGNNVGEHHVLDFLTPIPVGSDSSYSYGSENFLNPFTQMKRTQNGGNLYKIDALKSGTILDTIPGNDYYSKGWYESYSTTGNPPHLLWTAIDRGPSVLFVPSWGVSGKFVFLHSAYTENDDEYNLTLSFYDINSNAVTHYQVSPFDPVMWAQGICMYYHSGVDLIYISSLWKRAGDSYTTIDADCRLYTISSGGSIQLLESTYADGSFNNAYLTVTDICRYGNTVAKKFIVALMNRDDLDNTYELGKWYWQGGWQYETLMTSSSPFTKLVRGGANEDYDVFIFHKYQNRILRYDQSANAVVTEARGAEVVPGDGNISTDIVIDTSTRSDKDILYGISWTGEDPRALGGLRVPNKGLLWKYDEYITPYIELADFDSLSVADAIGKLAQVCNHIVLFNVTGDFYFIKRSITNRADYILSHIEERSIIKGTVVKDRGYSEIYNSFTLIPSMTEVSEIEFELILVAREEDEDDADFNQLVMINSLNNLKRSVRLICEQGGLISEDVWFKWLVEYDNIEARVGEEISSDERQFLLSSTFGGDALDEGVHTGDFILFNHPDDDSPIDREILGGQGVGNVTDSTDSPVFFVTDSSIYNVNDKVTAYDPTNEARSVGVVEEIIGNVVTTNGIKNSTTYEDLIAPIKSSPSYITIEESTRANIASNSEVTIVRTSTDVGETRTRKAWSDNSLTFLTENLQIVGDDVRMTVNNTDSIEIGNKIRFEGNDSTFIVTSVGRLTNKVMASTDNGETPTAVLAGANVSVFWSPSMTEFTKIPGTGFEVKIEYDAFFKPGDVFTIKTDGLILKDDSRSRKVAVSLTSKNKHGKLDFPTIKNRFINPVIGEILVRNLLDFYKEPHYHLKVPINLIPYIDFVRINRLASFKVISDLIFPNTNNYTRNFYLRSASIDIKQNKVDLLLIDHVSTDYSFIENTSSWEKIKDVGKTTTSTSTTSTSTTSTSTSSSTTTSSSTSTTSTSTTTTSTSTSSTTTSTSSSTTSSTSTTP